MWKLYSPRGRHRLDNSVRSYRAREWNTRRGEEASSPFLPSGARTYLKHTRGRKGLLSFSTLGSPHVLETREGEKRPPLLFYPREPARTQNTRGGEEASSSFLPSGARTYLKHAKGRRGLLSFSTLGSPHLLETHEGEKRPPLLFCHRGPARTQNTWEREEASSPFLPSGARTYLKHASWRRGLIKRPHLLFCLRAPARTRNFSLQP